MEYDAFLGYSLQGSAEGSVACLPVHILQTLHEAVQWFTHGRLPLWECSEPYGLPLAVEIFSSRVSGIWRWLAGSPACLLAGWLAYLLPLIGKISRIGRGPGIWLPTACLHVPGCWLCNFLIGSVACWIFVVRVLSCQMSLLKRVADRCFLDGFYERGYDFRSGELLSCWCLKS